MVNWTHTYKQTQGGIATLLVKVCGITEIAGVDACLELGVHHLGFNFVPASKRFIAPSAAKQLAKRSTGRAHLVGVFMDQPRETILEVLESVPLDAIQLHGSESPEFCRSLPIPVWKVFAVGLGWDPSSLSNYADVSTHLFDTAARNGVSGGTGKTFDWNLLPSNPHHPWFLAGGLTPENLGEAVTFCRPDGVDLNSGVESSPGIKDPAKLAAAMEIVSVWSTQAVVVGLPGRPGPDIEVDGALWRSWRLDSVHREPDIESRGLLDLLALHDHLVIDLSSRAANPASMASELIHWQMLAREHGRQIKFRIAESTMEALVRMSVVPLLDLVD